MNTNKNTQRTELQAHLPSVEAIQRELATAESINDSFGKDGIFARLFSQTLETMLEAELTEHLGYERYEAKGRNSGNNRNGKRPRKVRTSGGDALIQVPRDRIIFLDAIHIKLRREGKVENTAVYTVLGVDLDGRKEVLGHWLGDGDEGATFWLSVITDLQARGVEDIFIACIDGLTGFKDAIHAVFPHAEIQRCIIHQIRHSLRYVAWKDHKAFTADLKSIYRAVTQEEAETNLLRLAEKWGNKYAIAVRSWENNWEDLATFFRSQQRFASSSIPPTPLKAITGNCARSRRTRHLFRH
jgi:transposase-like protein